MSSTRSILKSLFVLFLLPSTALAFETPQPKQKTLEQWVQEALEKSFGDLRKAGKIPVTSAARFEADVLSSPMTFVRNYEVTREMTSVDIDRERLKGFLSFERELFASRGDVTLCLAVRRTSECSVCGVLEGELKKGVGSFFERRGIRTVAGPDFATDSTLSGDRAFEDYVLRAQAQGCDYAVLSTVSAYSDSSVESGSLKIDSYLLMRDRKQRSIRSQSTVRLSESAVLGLVSEKKGKLPLMAVAEAVALAANRAKEEQLEVREREAFLRIEGISNYNSFVTVKSRVLALVKGLELRERFLTSGTIEFVYPSDFKELLHEELRREVSQFGGVGGVAAELSKADTMSVTIKLL